jgi:hypothetical protein
MRSFILLFALIVVGCDPSAAQLEADAANKTAVCLARIQTECKPLPDGKKDRSCPAYVECRKYADDFEGGGK